MEDVDSIRKESRKRKYEGLTEEQIAEKKARKRIKKELADASYGENLANVDENANDDEVEIIKEKKSKKKEKGDRKVKLEPADEPQADAVSGGEEEEAEGPVNGKVKVLKTKLPINVLAVKMISFDECQRMAKENANCGMVIVKEKRHFALSYHLLGGNVMKSIDFILNQSVGKYRSVVRGVVIAVHGAKLIGNPRVIDDHAVFHCYAKVKQAVFQPISNQNYECVVKHISNDYISALILGAISITMPRDKNFRENLRGVSLEMGDTVLAKYTGISINRGLCSLRGNFLKIVKKGEKKEIKDEMPAVKVNTSTKFVDTDNESE
ncbi:unnamed protein product [Auanema sp. JU1783]|nr:unnamed protein product [Auanema sp. JU1783]